MATSPARKVDRDTGNLPLITLAFAFRSSFSPIPSPDEVPGTPQQPGGQLRLERLAFFVDVCQKLLQRICNAESGCCCHIQVWFKASCLWWKVVRAHGRSAAQTASALWTGQFLFLWFRCSHAWKSYWALKHGFSDKVPFFGVHME